MQETQAWSLGWEDPLEKGMATHSSILTWRIPWIEEPSRLCPWGHKEMDTTDGLCLTLQTFLLIKTNDLKKDVHFPFEVLFDLTYPCKLYYLLKLSSVESDRFLHQSQWSEMKEEIKRIIEKWPCSSSELCLIKHETCSQTCSNWIKQSYLSELFNIFLFA